MTTPTPITNLAPKVAAQLAHSDLTYVGRPGGFDGTCTLVELELFLATIRAIAIQDVTGLEAALVNLQAAIDALDIDAIAGLQAALDAKLDDSDAGITIAQLVDGEVPANQSRVKSVEGITGNVDLPLATDTTKGLFSPSGVIKLAGIANGATANATNAELRDRATHTGEQAITTIVGLPSALDTLTTGVATNADAIALNAGSIATNIAAISANTAAIAANAAATTAALATKITDPGGAASGQSLIYSGSAIIWGTPAAAIAWTTRSANGTLSPGENCIANTGVTALTLPTTPSGTIEIINNTTVQIAINRGGTATLSGISSVSGLPFSAQETAVIKPGVRASFAAIGGNWIAQATTSSLTFVYNGTPLSTNASNPLSAGGIIHYTGIVQGGGAFINPAGTSALTAAISSLDAGSAGVSSMTNRAASGENVITSSINGSWMGWRFSFPVRVASFIFQTRSLNSNHPRNFQVRVGNTASISSGTDVSGLTVMQAFANQTQVNAANTYYGPFVIDAPTWGNTVIWQINGFDSSGSFYFLGAQEIEFFGMLSE